MPDRVAHQLTEYERGVTDRGIGYAVRMQVRAQLVASLTDAGRCMREQHDGRRAHLLAQRGPVKIFHLVMTGTARRGRPGNHRRGLDDSC
jgi:hypothetical protein